MIKHLGEELVPFVNSGFARIPELPLVGEEIKVFCRVDDSHAVPFLILHPGEQQHILAAHREREHYYSFDLGPFSSPQTVTYRIQTGEESTAHYSFEVLREEVVTKARKVYRDKECLLLDLNDDLVLTLGTDGTMTLRQKPAATEDESGDQNSFPCRHCMLPICDGFQWSISTQGFWELKRLSQRVASAHRYRLFRNAQGLIRQVTLEMSLTARHILGTGERFDSVEQFGLGSNGRVVEKFTHQAEQTYLPIPFFLTERGFGWYRQSDIPVRMQFGETVILTQETEGEVLTRDHVLPGTPQKVLQTFLRMTGEPVLPPQWAFGLWISSNGWNCDREVDAQLHALKQYDYPASVMVLEQWSDERTFYLWHPEHWSDPANTVLRIRNAGLHLVLWQIPVIKHQWDDSPGETLQDDTMEAIQCGYVVRRGDGSPYRITERWFHHSLLPDFTNPEAVDWWFGKRNYLLDMGVEGFKTDGGEFLFEKAARLADGTSGLRAHNLYPGQYIGAYHEFLRQNGVEGVTFSRAGYSGAQTQPIHWAGDQTSEWSELQAQLQAGLSAGLSGILFWSFDIGGFAGPIPEAELYLRATAMGCFCPVMQWHSEPRGGQFAGGQGETYNNDRSPWNLANKLGDERVLTISCAFAHLRESLRPYLWKEAQACVREGRPLMAHLCLDFPGDERAWSTHDEYMLGREFLVAPIVMPGKTGRHVYLPHGQWRNYFTGSIHVGPCEIWTDCPLDRIPVYQREVTL